MSNNFIELSSTLLYTAFFLYLIATVFFSFTIGSKRKSDGKAAKIGITLAIIGFLAQVSYFITRWMGSGHAPVSNLFEFMTFFGMAIVLGFIIIYFIYKLPVLGLFALPVALIIIAYASMFPTEVSPLIPSLQSHWLYIHVTTVSLAQGILTISFVAGLIYLIRQIDQTKLTRRSFSLEVILYSLILFVGFILASTLFSVMNYNVSFEQPTTGNNVVEVEYHMPAIASPNDSTLITKDVMNPWFETPEWMHGADAGRKLNTLIWSFIFGTGLYLLLFLVFRKRIGAVIQPLLKNARPDLLDEICYRAVAIGFPAFTLGGLIFAAIWAEEAWGRFWGWDPKEVWALITWFFYAAFLHLRLSRGWHGEKSAWLAAVGFAIIMFNLIVVNLVLAGLHSYA
ncbi:MAG: c-type cytochrome biogenesis protein CcsB [Bacillota bacterium]|uniref:c-type cytochrome biogenesis protein CcsB n=1 Tax=Virgibacillus TaxID=84406 RepID=UPI00040EF9C6|nr:MULTISPECIES: c-type cytochrome biogenesis protein CcsB [Bacillaceae]MCC2249056.1 c-type cytochrome biogenesis protein CcsB [Virgibacillus sp. AGTR]MDY7043416.1 c-type cytochrome biogenesis protein CcsB [Virgibacillus sp. M23]QRZ16980.1 c-type cytochrome biogenesis protein CcsB [Virgibacillus sp. AGTR]